MSDAGPRVLALPPSVLAGRPVPTLRDLGEYAAPDAVWVLGPDREPKAFARARECFDAPAFHPPLATNDGPVRRRRVGADGPPILTVRGASTFEARADEICAAVTEIGNRTDAKRAVLACDDVATTVRPTALETTVDRADALATALPAGRVTTLLTGSLPAGYDERWYLEPGSGAVVGVDHDPEVTARDPGGPMRDSGGPAHGSTPELAECAGGQHDEAYVRERRDEAYVRERRDEEHVGERPGDGSVGIRLRGVGPVEGYGGTRSASLIALSPSGVEGVESLSVENFGLEAISGIGPKTASRLAERGIRTRTDLLETSAADLADLSGIGRSSARTMRAHARVLETGEPLRLTDESLPGEGWPRPPLCLDIETDGLSPTIIWQIGVYDPECDAYRAFVEREDPTDPAPVLEAFCDWLLGIHPDRALLTWNGWRFDYRHLGAFLARHVPHYAEEWESVPKLDCYGWAVRDGNALLPGRTNKLADVASALGYDGAGTGLDGATTAAAYQRFVRTGSELEWERHEAYCEDDCRALWHVYERLREAPMADEVGTQASGRGRATGNSAENGAESEQTGLGDFGA